MIRRYNILAQSGRFETWGKDSEDVLHKFQAVYPAEPPPFIFLFGEMPESLDYDMYKKCLLHNLNTHQIQAIDKQIGIMLQSLDMEEQTDEHSDESRLRDSAEPDPASQESSS